MNTIKTKCQGCSTEFEHPAQTWNQKYCSAECRKISTGASEGTRLTLNCGNMGALSELLVCADLLKRGYEVFRAVSPSCSCDLIALKNKVCMRVEVRTGYQTPRGPSCADKNNPNRKERHEILAVVVAGIPFYFPSLDQEGGTSAQ